MTEKNSKFQVKDTPPESAGGLRQAGGQANASLPFVPARQSSALALERELLIKALAIIKLLLQLNKQERDSNNGY